MTKDRDAAALKRLPSVARVLSLAIASLAIVILVIPLGHSLRAQDFELKPFRSIDATDRPIVACRVNSSERLLAVGDAGAKLTLFDLAKQVQLRQWQPSKSTVIAVAFAPDKPYVLAASFPKTMTLYDAAGDKQIWQVETPVVPTRVSFSADGKRIAASSVVGKAAVYDAETGKRIVVVGHGLPASGGAVFSRDGETLYVAATPFKGQMAPSKILRCDAGTGEVEAEFGIHGAIVRRLRLSPSETSLASIDRDGVVKLWDTRTRGKLHEWTTGLENGMGCEFLDDNQLIVSGKDRVLVLRRGTQQPVADVDQSGGTAQLAALVHRGIIASAVGTKINLFAFDRSALEPAKVAMPAADRALGVQTQSFDPLDNVPPKGVVLDGLVQNKELAPLVGMPVFLRMKSGLSIGKARLAALQFDRRGHGLKFLKYELESGRVVTVKAVDLYSIHIGVRGSFARYHLRYFAPQKQLFLIHSKDADTVAANRLAANNRSLRVLLEEDEQKEATTEHKKFLEEAAEKLQRDGPFHVVETQSTLIFTDHPEASVRGLASYVDALNLQLNQLFGIPEGDSIWRGKAVLAVFSTKRKFAAFEERVMNNPNHAGRPGVRSGRTRFLQTAIATELTPAFARGICWGYSLGFAARLHSDSKSTPWLQMGIANLVQYAVVPNARMEKTQRDRVVSDLRRNGSMLGLIEATKLDQSRWPMSGQLVRFLVAKDTLAFGQFYRDTKLGIGIEEAILQNYGVSIDQLAAGFGNSLGVANLTP